MNSKNTRDIFYVASTQKDLSKLPLSVKEEFVFALQLAAEGQQHPSAKPLSGFHGRSVVEVVRDHKGDTYREVYTVRFEEAIYVLHVFQKKSKKGIETPKMDVDLIKQRLKYAESYHKELQASKKTKR